MKRRSAAAARATRATRARVRRLAALKTVFAPAAAAEKRALLAALRATAIGDPRLLIDYHEVLLFLRAYPDNAAVFRLACRECRDFGARVLALRAADPDAAAELEDTGIAHTGMYYAYDHAAVVRLVRWFGDALDIDWDAFEESGRTDRLDRLLPLFSAWAENDGLDLADISTRDWIALRKGGAAPSSLRWLLAELRRAVPGEPLRAGLYDDLDLPVVWRLGDAPVARTIGGRPAAKPTYHADGLLRRPADFRAEIGKPIGGIRRARRREAAALIKMARTALAVRHRALYPIDHANRDEVVAADVGRGYRLVLYGMQPLRRLPIESDYGVLILKNGFVFGYGVGAMLFEQVEIAVNIFDSWRGGESAFVFTQFVRVFRTHFGCERFKIERYQVGYENEEGIQSGSFWFYYRLGFVPRDPKVRALARKEQAKRDRRPAYRSPVPVLERLAESDLYLTLAPAGGAGGGAGGRHGRAAAAVPAADFPLADLGLRVTRMIGERFAGDRARAVAGCTERVARALGVGDRRRWPAAEREWFARLSLPVALIPDLERWPAAARAELAEILQAKGMPEEATYARRVARHRRLQTALARAARGK